MDGLDEPGIQPFASLMAEALIGVGREEEALDVLAGAEKVAVQRGHPTALVRAARVRSMAYLVGRDLPLALDVLDAAREHEAACQDALELALVDYTRGSVLRRLGRRREAAAVLDRASERLAILDAEPFLERCQREAAGCGLRPRTRREPSIELLTPQEHSVATLVAAGLSNREVAERLVVTAKTVEYHLGNVYRKFGVNSRGRMVAVLQSTSRS